VKWSPKKNSQKKSDCQLDEAIYDKNCQDLRLGTVLLPVIICYFFARVFGEPLRKGFRRQGHSKENNNFSKSFHRSI